MTRNRNPHMSRRNDAAKPAPKNAPATAQTVAPIVAEDDGRSPYDYPLPADPMRASIEYSLRDPSTPGGAHIEVLRFSLIRKVMKILGHPARCRDAACRRAKACVGPDIRCTREIPPSKATKEQGARNLAGLQRELRKRIEQDTSARAARAATAPGAPSRPRSPASNRSV